MSSVLSWPRLVVVSLVGISVAVFFWVGSRYPDLDAKSMMMGSTSLADALTVWPLFEIRPDAPLLSRIWYGTLNWLYANYKGMSFGVFFGGVFLTVLGYFKVPRTQNKMQNTLIGFFLGAPLGVCVNCAAPIFKGMLRSRRTETAFAAMLSSPTMNVVVLTMVFGFFPLYVGLVKVGFTLVMIMVVVPLLSKLLGNDQGIKDYEQKVFHADELLVPTEPMPQDSEKLLTSVIAALRDLIANFVYIAVRTVPLMFLAGFLGAVLSQTVPLDFLLGQSSFSAILIAAFIGVMLPIPIAVDVIIVSALYSQGMDISIVLVLLCTLGIYSIYSMMITWTSASKGWAIGIMVAAYFLSVGVGLVAQPIHQKFYIKNNLDSFIEQRSLFEKEDLTAVNRFKIPKADMPEAYKIEGQKLLSQNAQIEIWSRPNRSSQNSGGFRQAEGFQLGLARGFRYGIRDYPDPFWIGRGTAAGDYNQDGWDDIAFGTSRGIALYKNKGGHFELQENRNRKLFHLVVYAVAMIDIDGDGWLDLFFSTFNRGNYWAKNNGGEIDFFSAKRIDNGGGIITISPGFYDLNGDGRIDIVNGNMALGIVSGIYQQKRGRENSISLNMGGLGFENRAVGSISGETMSSLVFDLNSDGTAEIIFNNDFIVPDEFLSARKRPVGEFSVEPSLLVDRTPYFSMSADVGDVDGDLDLDLLMYGTIKQQKWVGKAKIEGRRAEQFNRSNWELKVCDRIRNPVIRRNCQINRETNHLIPFYERKGIGVNECSKLADLGDRQDCLVSTMWMLVTNEGLHDKCEERFGSERYLREVCEILIDRGERLSSDSFENDTTQVNDNFIYAQTPEGKFKAIRTAQGGEASGHPGGWTWNAKFVDYDNDGDLDIFNAEGSVRTGQFGWNVMLENNGVGMMRQRQFSLGLVNDFNLFSFVRIDFDNDGDIDFIGNSSTGPVQVYVNEAAGNNNSVSIRLSDSVGNSFGIGAKIYAEIAGRTVLRVIKASGGYQSFDPLVAHFGMGPVAEIVSLRIVWPDGEETNIEQPLAANHRYLIKRNHR